MSKTISDRLKETAEIIPGELFTWLNPLLLEAADHIELQMTQLETAVTALRRINSLAEKNAGKYAQQIAAEGLRRPVERGE